MSTGPSSLVGADILTISTLDAAQVRSIFDLAARVKADVGAFRQSLAGISAILIFEKPSLRTKVTFEVGIRGLGGNPVYLDQSGSRLGERESIRDYGKNLERWVQCIVARVYSQRALEDLALHAGVPVVNALSDRFHPCQALADLFTLREKFGELRGRRLAFVGDGNNVCHSLMHCAALLGVDMTVVTPAGYAPAADVTAQCEAFARASGATLTLSSDIQAVAGHDAVYTDVWVSMGQADEGGKRAAAFRPYQVNAALMAIASRGLAKPSLFMHCLPAQRGVEVTDEVIDAPSSVVYDQAENRMHAQNALLLKILRGM
ncbi:MAG TPA: ornithine carbamoyltransferase [Phycisphaerales bacterium]|nr:ornithine carbamoyltransferase [Phycisphaerales bacterium]